MTERLAVELGALAMIVVLVALRPRWARVAHARLMVTLGRLARHPVLVCLFLGVGTAGIAAIHATLVHWPEPSIHDEFAYLLGAETFAGGELTRPTHAHWQHFETLHVLQTPTYAPKYPPGQALALASGKVLTGEVRAGLWLEAGGMVAAIVWMLFQWLPGRWAVLGGVVVALQLGVRGPWVQTFYGGSLAALGGALMLGAVPGILQRRSLAASLVMAVGLSVLAVTRPFEGLIASLPVAVVLAASLLRARGEELREFLVRVAAPITVVLGATLVGIGAHNSAVTGDSMRLPYVEYDEQYSVYPPFLWQPTAPEPEYRIARIRDFMIGSQAGSHAVPHEPAALARLSGRRIFQLLVGLLGSILIVPLVLAASASLVRVARRGPREPARRALLLPLAVAAAVGLASCVTTFAAPRYAAPALGALMVLLMVGWKSLTTRPRRQRARAAALSIGILLALGITTAERGSKRWLGGERYLGHVRSTIRDSLRASPGRDLVLVRVLSSDAIHQEFVFNGADIDASEIVWAHELAPEMNEALLRYFPDRVVWLLVVESVVEDRWTIDRLER